MALASCTTTRQSATTRSITAPVMSAATAELSVSPQKVTYVYETSRSIRKGGVQNCINAAIRELLARNGDADVLVEAQEAVVERSGLFGSKITRVTVSGYPAKYKNIQSVEKSVLEEGFVKGVFPAVSGSSVKVRP